MTSRAERRREARQREQDVGRMSAPLLARLRPITLADMVSGQSYKPGSSVLWVAPMSLNGEGEPERSLSFVVYLPPDHRTSTPENVKLAIALLKHLNPRARTAIEELQHSARAPKSRRAAVMATKRLPQMEIERPAPVAAEPAHNDKDSRREHSKSRR